MVEFDKAVREEIVRLWNNCIINPDKMISAEANAKRILKNKYRYELVEKETTVPWHVIAMLHTMESDCNFDTHLHNGDSLKARTVQVPAGRPVDGNPPFTWEESAIDALRFDHLADCKDWSIASILFMCEKYNGFGYRKHGVPSSYVWCGTSIQKPGRYVKDGVWDANSISKRVGIAAMLLTMIKMGVIQNGGVIPSTLPTPIPDNPRSIVEWTINSNDIHDVRGYDANGKVMCWLDSQGNLENLYYAAVMAGAPRAKFTIKSMAKKPSFPAPTGSNASKFVEFYKHNYNLVRMKVEAWFTPKHSPSATKNGCVAHVYSCLWLCNMDRPKVDSMESINVDYFFAWALKNGWKKITDMTKLEPGDVCVSGPNDHNFDHVCTFVEYVDAKNAYVLDNQKDDLHVRALQDGSCGEWQFAVRMP